MHDNESFKNLDKALAGRKCPSFQQIIEKFKKREIEFKNNPLEDAFVESWGLEPKDWKILKVDNKTTVVRNIITGETRGLAEVFTKEWRRL